MNNLKAITKQLKELGFNHNEAKVYVALTQLGEDNATNIAKKADLPRTTVISILKKLEKEKYISIQRYRGKSVFWIESPQMLKQAFLSRVKMADELNDLLSDLYRSEADFPYAKIYDSKTNIKTFIEKTILDLEKKSTIFTIESANSGNYHKILSEDFFYAMLRLKKEKGIVTKSLVVADSIKNIHPKKMEQQSIILREMPEEIEFKASFWIIGDMLVLFSGKYPFIVAVNHRIITYSMKSIFDYLWNISGKK
ncbi:MAG: helix-turn-helix domain-containing protein [Parcubacteria group bacterium]|jgi:sugar-specific transcriptional regulator TrmB